LLVVVMVVAAVVVVVVVVVVVLRRCLWQLFRRKHRSTDVVLPTTAGRVGCDARA
jgi:hypothetical protein